MCRSSVHQPWQLDGVRLKQRTFKLVFEAPRLQAGCLHHNSMPLPRGEGFQPAPVCVVQSAQNRGAHAAPTLPNSFFSKLLDAVA